MRFCVSVADMISSSVRFKVAGFLLTHEAPMSEREIASVLKISHMSVNRAVMNRRLYEALAPGGVLIVADHSARPGTGISVGKTLHRIDEAVVREELEAAGFKLAARGEFLRNPADPRDTVVFRSPVPVDEFVLKFVKPR